MRGRGWVRVHVRGPRARRCHGALPRVLPRRCVPSPGAVAAGEVDARVGRLHRVVVGAAAAAGVDPDAAGVEPGRFGLSTVGPGEVAAWLSTRRGARAGARWALAARRGARGVRSPSGRLSGPQLPRCGRSVTDGLRPPPWSSWALGAAPDALGARLHHVDRTALSGSVYATTSVHRRDSVRQPRALAQVVAQTAGRRTLGSQSLRIAPGRDLRSDGEAHESPRSRADAASTERAPVHQARNR